MVGGYGDLLFQFGLVDENEKSFFDSQTELAISYIQKKDFFSAFKVIIIGEVIIIGASLTTFSSTPECFSSNV